MKRENDFILDSESPAGRLPRPAPKGGGVQASALAAPRDRREPSLPAPAPPGGPSPAAVVFTPRKSATATHRGLLPSGAPAGKESCTALHKGHSLTLWCHKRLGRGACAPKIEESGDMWGGPPCCRPATNTTVPLRDQGQERRGFNRHSSRARWCSWKCHSATKRDTFTTAPWATRNYRMTLR